MIGHVYCCKKMRLFLSVDNILTDEVEVVDGLVEYLKNPKRCPNLNVRGRKFSLFSISGFII